MTMNVNKNVFTILVSIWPILNIYSFQQGGLIGLGDIFIFLFILLHIKNCLTIENSKYIRHYSVFYIYIILITAFVSLVYQINSYGSMLRLVYYYFIVVFVMDKYMDIDFGKKTVCIISILNSAMVYVQWILYLIMGKVTFWIFGAIPLSNGLTYDEMYTVLARNSGNYYFRASGMFTEPAHLAQYAILGIVILLFSDSKNVTKIENKKFGLAVFCSGATILSTSSIGIVVCVFIWFYWLVGCVLKDIIPTKVLLRVLFIVIIGVVFFIFAENRFHLLTILQEKLKHETIINPDSSFAYRVTRGFKIYSKMGLEQKIFGVGFGNIGDVMRNSLVFIDYAESDYMNSFAYILCSSGIVGFILFVRFLFINFKISKFVSAMTVFIILLFISSSTFNSAEWLLYMGLSLVAYNGKYRNV